MVVGRARNSASVTPYSLALRAQGCATTNGGGLATLGLVLGAMLAARRRKRA